MSAERIYNLIEEQENQNPSNGNPQNQDQPGAGGPPAHEGHRSDDSNTDGEPTAPSTPGGIGQVLDAPEAEDGEGKTVAEQSRQWQIAVEQAENGAKLAGNMLVGAARTLEPAQAARVDWRELLRRAWSETIPSVYTWLPPNRRHVSAGLYLPGISCEGVGEMAFAVNCSGTVAAISAGCREQLAAGTGVTPLGKRFVDHSKVTDHHASSHSNLGSSF
jgi:hypothetical protein